MAYYVSCIDESELDLEKVKEVLQSEQSVKNLDMEFSVPNVKGSCEFRGSGNSFAEIRVFNTLISLDGYDEAILEFAVWFQKMYDSPLNFGNPEAPSEIELSPISSVEALLEMIEQEWI